MKHVDGSTVWLKMTGSVRKRADGATIVDGVAIDVTALETARQNEQRRAERDTLTGLPNRDGLAKFLG